MPVNSSEKLQTKGSKTTRLIEPKLSSNSVSESFDHLKSVLVNSDLKIPTAVEDVIS